MADRMVHTPGFENIEEKNPVYSVSELNRMISLRLQTPQLQDVLVRGQVTGISKSLPGHVYFQLKDDQGKTVSCAIFKFQLPRMGGTLPANGDEIVAHGKVNLYEDQGKISLVVDRYQAAGLSLLYQQFLELKDRLMAEGLFDPQRKKKLPAHPGKVAMITSREGAVFHDVCKVAGQRDPGIPIVLIPSPVQGADAGRYLAACVRFVQRMPDIDVVIIGRGGGSMEDLWCFNDERLVREVAACRIPIVSAVGHQTDVTLCDFAADVRAATPSDAAEIVFPDRSSTRQRVQMDKQRMQHGMSSILQGLELRVSALQKRLAENSPISRLDRLVHRHSEVSQRLDAILNLILTQARDRVIHGMEKMDRGIDFRLTMANSRLQEAGSTLIARSPEGKIRQLSVDIEKLSDRLTSAMEGRLKLLETETEALSSRMNALNPSSVLNRGYAFVTDGEHVVSSSIHAPEHMQLHFQDGVVAVRKEQVHSDE